ncbi:MAG: hypothetical protein J3Q66DRAFT_35947 [Benniella sp.]|nr:MAG: hypothetical protein J3Q66DRAFT_35947 [Benniella sp.]
MASTTSPRSPDHYHHDHSLQHHLDHRTSTASYFRNADSSHHIEGNDYPDSLSYSSAHVMPRSVVTEPVLSEPEFNPGSRLEPSSPSTPPSVILPPSSSSSSPASTPPSSPSMSALSTSYVSSTRTVSRKVSVSTIVVSSEVQRQTRESLREILEHLEEQQYEQHTGYEQDEDHYHYAAPVRASVQSVQSIQVNGMTRVVHTRRLNPELLSSANSLSLQQHHGGSNLHHA